MPLLVQTIDALWYSLCPSFGTSFLPTTRLKPWTSRHLRTKTSSRWLHLRDQSGLPYGLPAIRAPPMLPAMSAPYTRPRASPAPCKARIKRYATSSMSDWNQRACLARSEVSDPVAETILNTRYANLKRASGKAQYQLTHDIVRQLVHDHGEAPNLRLYEALILCNASTFHGSIRHVELLLEEMELERIPPDSAVFHAILKVLDRCEPDASTDISGPRCSS